MGGGYPPYPPPPVSAPVLLKTRSLDDAFESGLAIAGYAFSQSECTLLHQNLTESQN